MKTFEEFISKAKGAVDVIGEKAGQFMDVSKLNLKLLELKSELKSELENLGKIVYECTDEKILDNLEVKNQVNSIKTLKEEIENLKTQIAFAKNKLLCKACGSYNEIKSSYCANCGNKLKEDAITPKVMSESEVDDNTQDSEEDDFVEFDD